MSQSLEAEDLQRCFNHENSSILRTQDWAAKQPEKPGNLPTGNTLSKNKLLCPECGAPIRSYFLNPNEKVLMCSRTRCNYPLEEKQIFYNLAKRFEEEVVKRLLQKRISKKVD